MRKITLCLLALLLTAALTTAVVSAGGDASGYFPDTQNHWAKDAVKRWTECGVLSGYSDGTFRPDAQISLAELCSILDKLIGFPDVPSYNLHGMPENHWGRRSIEKMYAYYALVQDGSPVNPDEKLTREKACYMIAYAFGIQQETVHRTEHPRFQPITDWADVQDIYTYPVSKLISAMVIKGYADNTFRPAKAITRGEIATILNNMIDEIVTEPGDYEFLKYTDVLVKADDVHLRFVDGQAYGVVHSYLYIASDRSGISVSSDVRYPFTICNVSTAEEEPEFHLEDINVSTENCHRFGKPSTLFAGGYGTEYRPYLISNAEMLSSAFEITDEENILSFSLVSDITIGSEWETSAAADSAGNLTESQTRLHGNGHSIIWDCTKKITENLGLCVMNGVRGSIEDIHFTGKMELEAGPEVTAVAPGPVFSGCLFRNCSSDVRITVNSEEAQYLMVGGLTGWCENVRIENCSSSADIEITVPPATYQVIAGGIAGQNSATIKNCSFDGQIRITSSLLGSDVPDDIEVRLESEVKNRISAGGITGYVCDLPAGRSVRETVISNCRSSGTIDVFGDLYVHINIGGIAGTLTNMDIYSDPNPLAMNYINCCYSEATLLADCDCGFYMYSSIGGIAGRVERGRITACEAKPDIPLTMNTSAWWVASYWVGGIVGRSTSANLALLSGIDNCRADCSKIRYEYEKHFGLITYGGLVCWNEAKLTNSYSVNNPADTIKYLCAIRNYNWSSTELLPENCTYIAPDHPGDFTGWDFENVWIHTQEGPRLRTDFYVPQK